MWAVLVLHRRVTHCHKCSSLKLHEFITSPILRTWKARWHIPALFRVAAGRRQGLARGCNPIWTLFRLLAGFCSLGFQGKIPTFLLAARCSSHLLLGCPQVCSHGQFASSNLQKNLCPVLYEWSDSVWGTEYLITFAVRCDLIAGAWDSVFLRNSPCLRRLWAAKT